MLVEASKVIRGYSGVLSLYLNGCCCLRNPAVGGAGWSASQATSSEARELLSCCPPLLSETALLDSWTCAGAALARLAQRYSPPAASLSLGPLSLGRETPSPQSATHSAEPYALLAGHGFPIALADL